MLKCLKRRPKSFSLAWCFREFDPSPLLVREGHECRRFNETAKMFCVILCWPSPLWTPLGAQGVSEFESRWQSTAYCQLSSPGDRSVDCEALVQAGPKPYRPDTSTRHQACGDCFHTLLGREGIERVEIMLQELLLCCSISSKKTEVKTTAVQNKYLCSSKRHKVKQ